MRNGVAILSVAVFVIAVVAFVSITDESDAEESSTFVKVNDYNMYFYLTHGLYYDSATLFSATYEGHSLAPHKELTIPDEVTIGGKKYHVMDAKGTAFDGLNKLEKITFGDSFREFDTVPFSHTPNLKVLNFGKGFDYYNDRMFSSLDNLEAVNIDNSNPVYSSENGVLYDYSKTTLLYYPIAKQDRTYTLPSDLTGIDKNCRIWENPYLRNIETGNNHSFSSEDGILYNLHKTEVIVFPMDSQIKNYVMPDTLLKFTFPTKSNMDSISISPLIKITDETTMGFAAGQLTIHKGMDLPTGRYVISLIRETNVPDAITDASQGNKVFALKIGDLTSFSKPVSLKLYEITYSAGNLHLYHAESDGTLTEIDDFSKSKSGASFETSLPGYYTYDFPSSTIANAEAIAAVIAIFGTVLAITGIYRNIRRH